MLSRAVAIWLLLMCCETVQGIVRRVWIEPLVGELRSKQIGVILGSLVILVITYKTVRWLNAKRTVTYFLIGMLWVILTVSFEIFLGRLLAVSLEQILSDYDPSEGGLMIFGLLAMELAPLITAKIRESSRI